MSKAVMTRAAIGAALIGVGLSLMLSASRKMCVECEETPAVVEVQPETEVVSD